VCSLAEKPVLSLEELISLELPHVIFALASCCVVVDNKLGCHSGVCRMLQFQLYDLIFSCVVL
jgi:hypothetical protein